MDNKAQLMAHSPSLTMTTFGKDNVGRTAHPSVLPHPDPLLGTQGSSTHNSSMFARRLALSRDNAAGVADFVHCRSAMSWLNDRILEWLGTLRLPEWLGIGVIVAMGLQLARCLMNDPDCGLCGGPVPRNWNRHVIRVMRRAQVRRLVGGALTSLGSNLPRHVADLVFGYFWPQLPIGAQLDWPRSAPLLHALWTWRFFLLPRPFGCCLHVIDAVAVAPVANYWAELHARWQMRPHDRVFWDECFSLANAHRTAALAQQIARCTGRTIPLAAMAREPTRQRRHTAMICWLLVTLRRQSQRTAVYTSAVYVPRLLDHDGAYRLEQTQKPFLSCQDILCGHPSRKPIDQQQRGNSGRRSRADHGRVSPVQICTVIGLAANGTPVMGGAS